MAFHTPHGSTRFRLPWSWSSFDYRTLCQALYAQTDARFEIAKVQERRGDTVITDRGDLTSPLIVDALGWRRVLGPGANVQPPEAAISRGLEVHPHGASTDLDVWIDRSLVRHGYAWSVPAAGEQRIGVGSYQPRDHVKEPTKEIAARLDRDAVRYQGNWFPHKLRPAAEDGVFFVGDSAGHCIPLSGEGIRTAFYFGIAAGRQIRRALEGKPTDRALKDYAAFSRKHAPAFAGALALQRTIPRLPPRAAGRDSSHAGPRSAHPARVQLVLSTGASGSSVESLTIRSFRPARWCRSVRKPCLRSSSMPSRDTTRSPDFRIEPRSWPLCAAPPPPAKASPCCSWTSTTSRSSTTASATRPATAC